MKAADYPYTQPDSSQLVLAETTVPITGVRLKEPIAEWMVRNGDTSSCLKKFVSAQYEDAIKARRCPVIAYGSNANAEVLRKKLAGAGPVFVPMLRAELRDCDVVYSAHVSPSGAIPATLSASPGTCLTVFVLLLDAAQLSALHETEPNYDCMLLNDAASLTVDGGSLAQAYVYVSRCGLLNVEGQPRALEAVSATGRVFPTLTEPQVLEYVTGRLAAPPASDRGEAAQGEARDCGIGDDQDRQVQKRTADTRAGGVERGGHRL